MSTEFAKIGMGLDKIVLGLEKIATDERIHSSKTTADLSKMTVDFQKMTMDLLEMAANVEKIEMDIDVMIMESNNMARDTNNMARDTNNMARNINMPTSPDKPSFQVIIPYNDVAQLRRLISEDVGRGGPGVLEVADDNNGGFIAHARGGKGVTRDRVDWLNLVGDHLHRWDLVWWPFVFLVVGPQASMSSVPNRWILIPLLFGTFASVVRQFKVRVYAPGPKVLWRLSQLAHVASVVWFWWPYLEDVQKYMEASRAGRSS